MEKKLVASKSIVRILVGGPGSGKSTYSSKLKAKVINQDTLGSRKTCIKEFKKALESNTELIIIDRCNINKEQRKVWIDISKAYNVSNIECIHFKVPLETCIERIKNRKNHKTIKEDFPIDRIQKIVYDFNNSLEVPEISEGFSRIENV